MSRIYRLLALILAIAGTIALVYAIMAFRHAPAVSDLYNLVYHNSRPRKPETPAIFLFGFPAMLIAGSVVMTGTGILGYRSSNRLRWTPSPGGFVFLSLLWTAIFFSGSIHRSLLVLHHS